MAELGPNYLIRKYREGPQNTTATLMRAERPSRNELEIKVSNTVKNLKTNASYTSFPNARVWLIPFVNYATIRGTLRDPADTNPTSYRIQMLGKKIKLRANGGSHKKVLEAID